MIFKKRHRNSNERKQFSLGEFIWLGFNYSVGISFIGSLTIFSNFDLWGQEQGLPNYDSIGMHIIWILILEGLIAGTCAWAFAKLSRVHQTDRNGGAYNYVRSTFGRLSGFIVASLQYILLPFLITIHILGTMKMMFTSEYVGNDALIVINWGNFTDLYLDIISIVIFTVAALAIFGGIKFYKSLTKHTATLKWVTSAVLIIAAIVLAFQNGSENYARWTNPQDYGVSGFSINGFIKAFTTCFFFFAGFETFATAGKNIQNPEKNMSKGLLTIMALSTLFYVVVTFIFFGAVSSFQQTMTIATWYEFKNILWVVYAGQILMIISTFILKVNIAMQTALYGGTILQPLAEEGYIPEKVKVLNKDNLPIKAAVLNFYISGIFIFIWLIIPDLIKGFSLMNLSSGVKYIEPFSVNTFFEAQAVFLMFIYMIIICCVLVLGFRKQLKIKNWEWILFSLVLGFLGTVFIWHYYLLFFTFVTALKDYALESNLKARSSIIACVIEIGYVVAISGFIFTWYFIYYYPKLQKRIQTNLYLQNKLDANFLVLDDWQAVRTEVCKELQDYLTRNWAIHQDINNPDYLQAKKIVEILEFKNDLVLEISLEVEQPPNDVQPESQILVLDNVIKQEIE